MAYDPDKDVVTYDKFLGLRNTVNAESFEAGDLEAALNVDLTDAQRLRRRRGYVSVIAGSYHSLWSNGATALIVGGTTLYEVTPTLTLRSVRTGLTSGLRMYYTDMGDRVYYSNDAQTGAFQNGLSRSWGLTPPTQQPVATVRGGSLRAGRYQFALTFVRNDGQESGTPGSDGIELTTTGGIEFSNIPVSADPGVTSKRLYVSSVNGDQLFALMVLPNATTTATYEVEKNGTLPLATQFLAPPPAGQHLGELGGRTLIARGNRLYVSEPWAPELFDLRRNYPMPSRITLVAPVSDGLYLGSESEIGWLAGLDPEKWSYTAVADYGAIPGTLGYDAAENLEKGATGKAAIFATNEGICVGRNGGAFQNFTFERYSYPPRDEGAALVRDTDGTVQFVVTLKGTERPANVAL